MHMFKSHDGRLWLAPFHSTQHSESAQWACSMPANNRYMTAVLCLDLLAIALLVFGNYGYETGYRSLGPLPMFSGAVVVLASALARVGLAKVQACETVPLMRGYVPVVLHLLFVGLLLLINLAFVVRAFGQLLV